MYLITVLQTGSPSRDRIGTKMQVASSIDFRALTLNILMRCRALVYAQDVFPMRVGTLTSPNA